MNLKSILRILIGAILIICTQYTYADKTPIISIIIDDIGNNLENGQRALKLPSNVTLSILPNSAHSIALNNQAFNMKKEVMLHTPMQAIVHHNIGRGGLNLGMSKKQFIYTLRKDLDSLPYKQGINNHMGSLLTQSSQAMEWLMEEIQDKELYFVDSRTSANTVAEKFAKKHHVPTIRRDVFLDDIVSPEAIDKQFKRLLRIAKSKGYAVAIAHPHPTTLDYLEKVIPKLKDHGYKLVPVSQLIAFKANKPNITSMFAANKIKHLKNATNIKMFVPKTRKNPDSQFVQRQAGKIIDHARLQKRTHAKHDQLQQRQTVSKEKHQREARRIDSYKYSDLKTAQQAILQRSVQAKPHKIKLPRNPFRSKRAKKENIAEPEHQHATLTVNKSKQHTVKHAPLKTFKTNLAEHKAKRTKYKRVLKAEKSTEARRKVVVAYQPNVIKHVVPKPTIQTTRTKPKRTTRQMAREGITISKYKSLAIEEKMVTVEKRPTVKRKPQTKKPRLVAQRKPQIQKPRLVVQRKPQIQKSHFVVQRKPKIQHKKVVQKQIRIAKPKVVAKKKPTKQNQQIIAKRGSGGGNVIIFGNASQIEYPEEIVF